VRANKIVSISIVLFLWVTLFSCSESLKSEEGKVEELITDFYAWYADQIEFGNNLAFQPDFYEDSSRVTALDFRVVESNLGDLGFHHSYIVEYKNEFSECTENLKSVSLDSLKNFDGIAEYERIDCDFFNSYHWTKDMEAHDGVEVISVEFDGDKRAKAVCKIYNTAEKMRIYWEHKEININLEKMGDSWKIRDLEVVVL